MLLVCCLAQADDGCGDTPYSVAFQSAHAQIEITLPPGLANDAMKPGPTVDAGLDYVRSMYAMIGPAVIRDLLEHYECNLKALIAEDETKTAAQKADILNSWKRIYIDITTTSSIYFFAFRSGLAEAQSINPGEKEIENPKNWNVAAEYIEKLPKDNFLIASKYDAYLKGSIKGLSGTICGSYLRAALAQNAGLIQPVAASVRPLLQLYVSDSPLAVWSAKASLYVTASSLSLGVKAPSDSSSENSRKICNVSP